MLTRDEVEELQKGEVVYVVTKDHHIIMLTILRNCLYGNTIEVEGRDENFILRNHYTYVKLRDFLEDDEVEMPFHCVFKDLKAAYEFRALEVKSSEEKNRLLLTELPLTLVDAYALYHGHLPREERTFFRERATTFKQHGPVSQGSSKP